MPPLDLAAVIKEASMRQGVMMAKVEVTKAKVIEETQDDHEELDERVDAEEKEELAILAWERPT